MKTNSTKNWIKVAGLTLAIGTFAFTANAQNTTTAVANLGVVKNSDVAGTAVKANGTIRLIDNKGTIKYLQVQNGITAITNTADDKTGVTTTWQLGGALINDTYIDLGSGTNHKLFSLDNLSVVAAGTLPATTALAAHGAATPSGWTMLVHDEQTGEVKKMLFADLLQVQAGQYVYTVTTTDVTAGKVTYAITTNTPSINQKVSVYRNGAKLVGGTSGGDYTLDSATGTVTIQPVTTYGEWSFYAGDVIEIQWVK